MRLTATKTGGPKPDSRGIGSEGYPPLPSWNTGEGVHRRKHDRKIRFLRKIGGPYDGRAEWGLRAGQVTIPDSTELAAECGRRVSKSTSTALDGTKKKKQQ